MVSFTEQSLTHMKLLPCVYLHIYYDLNQKFPQKLIFEYFFPSWWCHTERLWILGVGLAEVSLCRLYPVTGSWPSLCSWRTMVCQIYTRCFRQELSHAQCIMTKTP